MLQALGVGIKPATHALLLCLPSILHMDVAIVVCLHLASSLSCAACSLNWQQVGFRLKLDSIAARLSYCRLLQ
jgi:hypothetical protein